MPMRSIPQELAAHLDGGVTTLCHCWRLVRRDGAGFGFTDHDRDLAFGGVTYAARTGLEAAEATAELGFAVGARPACRSRNPSGPRHQPVESDALQPSCDPMPGLPVEAVGPDPDRNPANAGYGRASQAQTKTWSGSTIGPP